MSTSEFLEYCKTASKPGMSKKDRKDCVLNAIENRILNLVGKDALRKYKDGHSLMAIGICDGMTSLIDPYIQIFIPEMCVVTEDTIESIKNDINVALKRFY